ncbi:hypothetical protein JM83_0503 [Gillisia sp. Hel_I_86]|nr:hypothetical protein JM83_0503 [Gillisia sp. Hel_I_86]
MPWPFFNALFVLIAVIPRICKTLPLVYKALINFNDCSFFCLSKKNGTVLPQLNFLQGFENFTLGKHYTAKKKFLKTINLLRTIIRQFPTLDKFFYHRSQGDERTFRTENGYTLI